MMELTGTNLTLKTLFRLSNGQEGIGFSQAGRQSLRKSRTIIDRAVADRKPVYGVTTGLGSRATEALSEGALSSFSTETVLGRAHAAGPPLDPSIVRAALVVRLNGFLSGAAGVSEPVANHVLAVFNAGLAPVIGNLGSIGAADLLLGATMAESVMGLGGRMNTREGATLPAAEALDRQNLTPPSLGPRDGLALANHGCFSAAATAIGLEEANCMQLKAHSVAALSLIGFQANLSPMAPAVTALKPHPTDTEVADILCALVGDAIQTPRRLQDPISLRNAFQAFGVLKSALKQAHEAALVEINASSDNPAVLVGDDVTQSTGNYFTPHLTQACEGVSRAMCLTASLSVARIAKLCTERLSGLPQYLADPDVGTNGFAPLLKLAESLLGTIQQKAQPFPIWPSINADGVEDGLSHTLPSALALREIVEHSRTLIALEAIVAAQACDMQDASIPAGLQEAYCLIRAHSPRVRASRPLGPEIETLAAAMI